MRKLSSIECFFFIGLPLTVAAAIAEVIVYYWNLSILVSAACFALLLLLLVLVGMATGKIGPSKDK